MTNDIPQSILDQIPIVNWLPEKWRLWVIIIALASPYLTRAYYAVANGGGLKGIARAIWLGTNTPKDE